MVSNVVLYSRFGNVEGKYLAFFPDGPRRRQGMTQKKIPRIILFKFYINHLFYIINK